MITEINNFINLLFQALQEYYKFKRGKINHDEIGEYQSLAWSQMEMLNTICKDKVLNTTIT